MDELLGKKVPFSAQAEQAVIGSVLIDPACVPAVMEKLKADEFYGKLNRDIYETVYHMFAYGITVDPVTVLNQMRTRGVYQDNCEEYLAEVMRMTPTAANVLEYAAIVRDRALLRRLGETADEINSMVYEGSGEADAALEAAERKIYALRQGRNIDGLEPVGRILSGVYQNLAELSKNKGGIPGLPTGLGDLDNMIMGLNNSDLIILASRPGMGKTSLGLNIALHVGKKTGKGVAIFSLEMSKQQLAARLLSGEAYVDLKKLHTGLLDRGDWQKLSAATAAISKTRILISDNSTVTVSDIKAQCRRVKDLGLVVIDYLQLMSSAGKGEAENRLQAVSEISRMLKIMAKELNVPVLCLSQLSRASTQRTDKRPVLSDLRESGSLEQDADIVLGLYREDYFNRESTEHNTGELIVLKNRHGNTGTINVQWIPEYTTYMSLDTVHHED